ncbi:MAG: arylsulfatase A-like enzyme [Arenicella sp.]|jgi:arylsulfatase A-like enzyme
MKKYSFHSTEFLIAIFVSLLVSSQTLASSDKSASPNIVMILVDDAGLMDFAPFGGEAHMPNIQRLADQGVRFSNYRTSPLCAPSRAMLLTGVDNHRTGVATIPEVIPPEHESQTGYTLSLEPGVRTIADHLRSAGYRTYMTGKWHMGSRLQDLPVSHGFDRSFALDASGADNWEQRPYIAYYNTAPWFEDEKPATLPDDFYSSEFIVDKMIEYMAADVGVNGRMAPKSKQPFFAYLAFQAIHIPIQAPREFTENYEGVYNDGWHALRKKRWEKAQQLGLIPIGAALAPMPKGSRDWKTLSDKERRYYSKAMAVNAGMLEAMDHHIGRLIDWLERNGELDNTLFVVTSDNGPEFNDMITTPGIGLWKAISGYNSDIDTMGEKGSLVSIGPEWASAAASPNKMFKFYSSDGGIRVPLIISGPSIANGKTQSSFSMVTDITPTLLDYLNIKVVDDSGDIAITGRSLKPVLEGISDYTYSPTDAVGLEVAGNAALFKGQYKLARNLIPYGDGDWRLFDIQNDPGETDNLSRQRPALFQQLLSDYNHYAATHGVLPMPAEYDSLQQIRTNTYKKLISVYKFHLMLLLVLIAALVAYLVRRERSI